jgi:hypothetical protein
MILSRPRRDLRIIAAMRLRCIVLVIACACQRPDGAKIVATPELELVNPGAMPRPARYRLTKGVVTALELSTEMTIAVGDHAQPVPALVMDLEIVALDVAADGTAQVRTTITNASTTTGPATLQERLAQMRGIAIAATLSPDGKLSGAHADVGDKQLSPAVAEQLKGVTQSFEQIAIALPTQPIGVGARWRSTRALHQNGMNLTTVTVVDITSFDGDRLGFTVTSDVSGPEQDVDSALGRVHMRDIRGSGHGHGTIDLARMAMVGEMATAFHAEMAANGQSQALDMKLKLSTSTR